MKNIVFILIWGILFFPSCKKNTDNKKVKPLIKPKAVLKKEKSEFKESDFLKYPPKLKSTDEKVSLKYKLKKGDKKEFVYFLKMAMLYNNRRSEINTRIYGKYEISDIYDNDKMNIKFLVKRIVLSFNAGNKTINYDSEKTQNDNTMDKNAVKTLTSILNKEIFVTMDRKGNFSKDEIDKALEKLKNINEIDKDAKLVDKKLIDDNNFMDSKSDNEIKNKIRQIVNVAFIILPENKVKVKDTYKGRKNINDTSLSDLKTDRLYEIKSVSLSKDLVVLKPKTEFNIDNKKSYLKIRKNNLKGWILFDLKNGVLKESFLHSILDMKINNVNMKMDIKSRYKLLR